jgi:hypothetical protein
VRPPRWPFEPCRRADEQESGCGHKMPFESHPTLVSIQSSPYFGSRGNGDEGTDGFGIGGRVLDRSGGTGRGAARIGSSFMTWFLAVRTCPLFRISAGPRWLATAEKARPGTTAPRLASYMTEDRMATGDVHVSYRDAEDKWAVPHRGERRTQGGGVCAH